MEYLAKAIVELVALLKELFSLWVNGQGNVIGNVTGNVAGNVTSPIHLGDNVSSIFANGINFLAELIAEIMRQMSNMVS